MKDAIEIKKENIRKKVMSEIKKAKKEILATMDITEELNNPSPIKYFSLLEKTHKGGVRIKRIVFGPIQQYKIFLKKIKDKKLFFTGKHTKSRNYKRMIMIGKSKLFFRSKERFYFTTNDKYIEKYIAYFNKF